MRLIDADDLLVQYDREHEGPPGRARELIENAPTVKDTVKVIRCKDCIHRTAQYDILGEAIKLIKEEENEEKASVAD